MLVELWNPVVIEGSVECSFSGRVNPPFFLTPSSTDCAGQTTESFTGNPYDGHTLAAQMKQVESVGAPILGNCCSTITSE